MPAPTLKPLKRGKCLQDLKPLYDADFSKRDISQLWKSAPKLFDDAKDNKRKGNEEDSFIQFMKYLSLGGYIKRSVENTRIKPEIDLNLLSRNMKYAIKAAEELSSSLKERYEKEKVKEQSNILLKEKSESMKEKPKQPDVLTLETLPEKERKSITCIELYKILEKKPSSVLILDVRSEKDFLESHIKFDCCISVPQEILGSICSAAKLAEMLPIESRNKWSKRLEVEHLVLMDLKSSFSNLQPDSPLHRLQKIILEWDPHAKYRCKPLILDEGYLEWFNHYPMFTSNSNIQLPLEAFDEHLRIDDVVYPELLDETPKFSRATKPNVKEVTIPTVLADEKSIEPLANGKDTKALVTEPSKIHENEFSSIANFNNNANASYNIPSVDRSSKVAALKAYKDSGGQQDRNDLTDKDRNTQYQNEKNLLMNEENELLKKKEDEFRIEKDAGIEPSKSAFFSSPFNGDIKSIGESERQSTSKLKVNPSTPTAAKNLDLSPLSYGSGLKRSRSSPNIAQAIQDSEQKPSYPHFDRNSKPVIQKPQNLDFVNRSRNFQEVYGTVKPGLTGLRNLGNSCYMNSILQCISNIGVLNNYFCSGKYKEDMNRSPSNPTRGEVADEVAHVIRNLWLGQYRSIACRDFKRIIGKHMDQFHGCGQQDAHEFLTFLMDWLHNDLKILKEDYVKEVPNTIASSKNNNVDAIKGAINAWKDFKSKHESIMLTAFFIQQVSTVLCCVCGSKSMNFEEPTSNLTLLLPSTQRCTLSECLRLYTSKEKISGYKCESCHGLHDAEKSVDLCRLPPILIIHLKRFYADGFYQKRQTFVDFPLENLDMRNYTPNENQVYTIYNLCGVSNHYGTLEGGHYTAYCKNGGKWYKYDDQDVSEISRSDVKSPNAYILFYEAVK